jgi:hypothetical protein
MRGIEPVLVAPLRPGKGLTDLTRRGRGSRGDGQPASLGRSAGRGRRLAIGLLWGGLAVAAGVRFGTIAFQPILAGYRSGREIQSLVGECREARLRNERLHRQIAYLKTSAGIEEEARRLGWVRTGERPLQLVMPEKPATKSVLPEGSAAGTRKPAAAPTPRSSTAERVQQALATWSATKWLGALLQPTPAARPER